jgi:Protein of unknown function (DUF4058)/Protein of unknown function (DUF2934)
LLGVGLAHEIADDLADTFVIKDSRDTARNDVHRHAVPHQQGSGVVNLETVTVHERLRNRISKTVQSKRKEVVKLPSPFPGMDPYLEDPHVWPAFHRRLAGVLSHILMPGLQEPYEAVIGTRRYAHEAAEFQEDHIEIRQRSDSSLVTLIDIVSLANKTTETGRQAYLGHRNAALQRQANVVEIDLVKQGRPTLDYSRDNLPAWDYAVTVTRATQPERYEIYTATLQKKLPKFRLPLSAKDRDLVLDLQSAFTKCYEADNFTDRIDHRWDPRVPLNEHNRHWLDTLLVGHNLRKPLPPHAEIERVAYRLWEEEGRPQDRHEEHCYKALAQLR